MKYLITVLTLLFMVSNISASGHKVDYKVSGKSYEGYYIAHSKNAPLVLLIHDWDGLTGYEIKRSMMLNKLGYSVFAVDLFGKGVRPSTVKEKKKLTGELYKNRKMMRMLIEGALKTAEMKGGNMSNAVVVGYCFGGAAVLELARSGKDLKGFVSFHGGLTTPKGQDYSNTKGKLLILHGTADTAVPMEHFANLAKELEKSKINHEMTTYSGAPHAFTVFGSKRYRKDADTKSWNRFISFLKETIR